MKFSIQIKFTIFGVNFNPEEITSLCKIKPHRSWKVGDIITPSIMKRKDCGWTIVSEEIESDELNLLLDNMINKLKPVKESLRDYINKKELSSELACIIALKETTPSLNFDSKSVQFFGELGSSLDFDIYLEMANGLS